MLCFGRDICGDLHNSEQREWLITNGIGGYGCGTIAGLLTRHYHGLLVAALNPPLGRTLLLTKVEETLVWDGEANAHGNTHGDAPSDAHGHAHSYDLFADRLRNQSLPSGDRSAASRAPSLPLPHKSSGALATVTPQGYRHLEQFHLEGTIPVWTFACAEVLLEKRVWMQPGANTTYIRYQLRRAQQPVVLRLKALVNYRSHHNSTVARQWQMQIQPVDFGVQVLAFAGAVPFWIFREVGPEAPVAQVIPHHHWQRGYDLAIERYRGIPPYDDHLHAATFEVVLSPQQSFTLIASTEAQPQLQSAIALQERQGYEQGLIDRWQQSQAIAGSKAGSDKETNPLHQELQGFQGQASQEFPSLRQLVLAADQFVVDRPLPGSDQMGKTIIAGYPWFGDWGRDTMISLPGLAIATGRPDIARPLLQTFGRYFNQGMLPNLFPEEGATPTYNTVDATLWYFEALWHYLEATDDLALVQELFPALAEVITWHERGTRYQIHLAADGLIYAGEPGVQLTWMDAKVGDWVVTPRQGKPVEINALWYNALQIMTQFAARLGEPGDHYRDLAQQARVGFQGFWQPDLGYCYDVLDTPDGNDASLRPNQIFAISLSQVAEDPRSSSTPASQIVPLLTPDQQRSVVKVCGRFLLTSHGLRSLAPTDPNYRGCYGGDPFQRDGAYHQGTVWGWLIGAFGLAHWRVYGDRPTTQGLLLPLLRHLTAGCVGNLSEIFDGDAPMTPRGAFAQAWTVAEVLRLHTLLQRGT